VVVVFVPGNPRPLSSQTTNYSWSTKTAFRSL
jgi:hypothetical protein